MERVQQHCKQFNMDIKTELPPCTGVFTTIIGLPCVHKVQERMRANQTLEVNDFHFQWRLDRLEKLPPLNPRLLLREPEIVKSRRKDDGKRGLRELLRVEHIAIELDPSLTKRGKPRKDSQRAQVESIQPEYQRPAELAEVLLDLPARPGGPTFIACGRFYLTPGQQEEASFLNDDPVTATSPLPAICEGLPGVYSTIWCL